MKKGFARGFAIGLLALLTSLLSLPSLPQQPFFFPPGLMPSAGGGGPPVLDAQGWFTGIYASVSSTSLAITTVSANEIILLLILPEKSGSAPSVTAIDGCNSVGVGCTGLLTWQQRSRSSFLAAAGTCFLGDTCGQGQEVWWAFSAGTLSAHSFTVTFNTTVDFGTIIGGGVRNIGNPVAPWDPNVGLPNFKVITGANSPYVTNGFNTTNANDFLIAFFGFGNYPTAGDDACIGWTGVPVHHSTRDDAFLAYKTVATVLTGTTTTSENDGTLGGPCDGSVSNDTRPWQVTIDALAGN